MSAHRYWRLNILGNAEGSYTQFAELTMATANYGSNVLTPGTSITASSSYSGDGPSNLLDGNLSTIWNTSGAQTATLTIDFGSGTTYDIQQVGMTAGSSSSSAYAYAPNSFQLQSSDDNSTWTTVASFSGYTWTSQYQTKFFQVSPSTAHSWNPNDAGGGWTFTNSNLTATVNSGGASIVKLVRGFDSFSSGSHYFEVTRTAESGTSSADIGIANASESLNNYPGQTANSCGLSSNGSVSGGSGGTGAAWDTTGAVVGVAFNATKIWWNVGGTWYPGTGANPAGNVGGCTHGISGALYPALHDYYNADSVTMNAGGSSFTYAIPTGFTSIDGSQTGTTPGLTGSMTLPAMSLHGALEYAAEAVLTLPPMSFSVVAGPQPGWSGGVILPPFSVAASGYSPLGGAACSLALPPISFQGAGALPAGSTGGSFVCVMT